MSNLQQSQIQVQKVSFHGFAIIKLTANQIGKPGPEKNIFIRILHCG